MKDEDHDPIFIEALEWFARIKDEKASDGDQDAFRRWLSADPAHQDAFQRAQRLWDRFAVVTPEYERMRRVDALGRRQLLTGAAVFLVAGMGGYLAWRPRLVADYITGIGERRIFTLPDGSTAELGSQTALILRYTATERRAVLVAGQGFFSVEKDTARPFVVEAGSGSVRALGTRFDVSLTGADVTVTVVEHSVLVTATGHAPVEVLEGWQVRYHPDGVAVPQKVDLARVQEWRHDRIVFEDVPLRHVLDELQRYRRGKIVLLDSSIGDIPVTAVFDTTAAEHALSVIADTLPIRVTDAGLVTFVYRR